MKKFGRVHQSFVATASTAMLCLVASTGMAEAACSPSGNNQDQNIVCKDDSGGSPYNAGKGKDNIVIKAGKYDESISGGKDNDTIIIRDGAKPSEVLGGADNDRIVLKDGAKAGTIDGEDGRDTIVLRGGKADKVKGGKGNDTITLNGARIKKEISGGKGRDTITLKDGKVATVDGGDDNDTIKLNGAKVKKDIAGGDGRDTIKLVSGSANNVKGGKDNDTITLNGARIKKEISGGKGRDTITLKDGKVGTVDGGDDNDTIRLNGAKVKKDIAGGDGRDTIKLVSGSANNVKGGKDNDTITLNGARIKKEISGGKGRDTITLKDGKVGTVDGGDDNDTIRLNGAKVKKKIAGGDGNDRIILNSGKVKKVEGNDGRDTFIVTSEFDLKKVDTIDGGGKEDTLTLRGQQIRASKLPELKNVEIMKLRQETVLKVVKGTHQLQATDLLRVDETSSIDMSDGKANDKLVVPGDFASKGTLLLDAELNTSGGEADKLVIKGDVKKSGTTGIVITDVGDGSAGNTLHDPIKVVSVDGKTRDGDFVLDGPVFSGLLEYDLLRDGGDWNLVANVLDQAFVLPSVQTIVSGNTRQVIGSLRDRTTASFSGGRGPVADFGNPYTGSKWGTWIRLGGSKAKADGSLGSGLIAGGSSYDSTLGFIQGGVASSFRDDGASKLVASVFGHYSDSDADVSDAGGALQGTVSSDSAGVGASLTWLSTSGWYADLVGLASWHDIDTSTVNGASGSTDGDTLAGSLELGYSFRVNDNVNVIPQAQVVYQRTSIDDFTDTDGVTSSFSDSDNVDGRFGVAVEHVSAMHMADGVFKANGEISVLHSFSNDSSATINDQALGFDSDGTELLIGGGLAVVPNADGFSFGFQGDYTIPLTDDGREGFSIEATAGVTF